MIQKCFPGGKAKAFSVSYDDGVLQDIPFVRLLNKYGLKGTFNLNSGLMKTEFSWRHENGMEIKRLPASVVRQLYEGHEVASHTCTHPYMEQLSRQEILCQMGADRYFLEELLGREVKGFAVPFLHYSDLIADCAREVGFEYARISEESGNYAIPQDPYHWRGGKFHWDHDLEGYVRGFLETDRELALCQLVGHSYDLDVYGMWERMEAILHAVSEAPEVCPMTNLELARYCRAMDQLRITPGQIENPTQTDLWIRMDGRALCLKAGEKIQRKDDSK